MKREVFSICVIALFIFAVIPAEGHAKSVKDFPAEGDLSTGKMLFCHITANGTGRFIWWLVGATFHDFGSIALSTINFKNCGYAKIQSLFNPADCFAVTGNQSITLVNYVGYFITEPEDGLLHIYIDGIAPLVVDVPTS